MNLHDIAAPGVEAYSWYHLVGRNGHIIGIVDGHPMRHVYRIPRRTDIPPLGATHRPYWNPWNAATADALHPICGTLKTRSTNPNLTEWERWGARDCERCRELSANLHVQPLSLTARRDPWNHIQYTDRRFTPDPVLGR